MGKYRKLLKKSLLLEQFPHGWSFTLPLSLSWTLKVEKTPWKIYFLVHRKAFSGPFRVKTKGAI